MSLHVEIPEPLAARVAEKARSQGKSPQDLVLQAVTQSVDPFARLDELAAPDRFAAEETDEEMSEYLEKAKHRLRQERRTARP